MMGQEMSPYPEIAAEIPGIELERNGTTVTDEDVGTDENEETTNSERTCD